MALLRSSSLRGELFLEQIHNSDAPVSCDIPQKLVTFGVSRPCRPPGHEVIGLLVGHPSKVARIRDQICGATADCLPVWRVPAPHCYERSELGLLPPSKAREVARAVSTLRRLCLMASHGWGWPCQWSQYDRQRSALYGA